MDNEAKRLTDDQVATAAEIFILLTMVSSWWVWGFAEALLLLSGIMVFRMTLSQHARSMKDFATELQRLWDLSKQLRDLAKRYGGDPEGPQIPVPAGVTFREVPPFDQWDQDLIVEHGEIIDRFVAQIPGAPLAEILMMCENIEAKINTKAEKTAVRIIWNETGHGTVVIYAAGPFVGSARREFAEKAAPKDWKRSATNPGRVG